MKTVVEHQMNPLTGEIEAYIKMIEANDLMFEATNACQDRMVNSVDYNSFFGSELEQVVAEKAITLTKQRTGTLLSPGVTVMVIDQSIGIYPGDMERIDFNRAMSVMRIGL